MDLSLIQDYIPDIARWLNVSPATVLLLVTLVVTVANVTGRLIPDDKGGVMGVLRVISKIIGLVVANRVVGKVTPNDAAKVVAAQAESWTKVDLPEVVQDVAESVLEDKIDQVVPAFPRFKRDEDGRFAPKTLPKPLGDSDEG